MARESQHPADIHRLTAFGTPAGPPLEELLQVFARLRRTPHEHRAVDWLLARHARTALPDEALVALGAALLDRGDARGAAQLLAAATSSPALLLRADLAAQSGDLPAALTLAERVLARDIDWPGARERHARWTQAVGAADKRPARADALAIPPVPVPKTPFDIVREIGRGGAGAVYEAVDRVLGRTVALKVYHRPDRDAGQLLHEARVASAVAGPGVVRVFDVHPRDGWLAMQWAPMGTLRMRLRGGTGAAASPIGAWAPRLARALVRIHDAGWVHNDIKPANVLLCAPDAPLVTDFGAARRAGEPALAGSPGYVSPERQAGRASDPRDDVYGFGRVLEDALDALEGAAAETGPASPAPLELGAWRALAAACTGPDVGRPVGPALLARAELRD